MKFTIERSVLTKAMALASSIVEAKTTIPILANVVLEAKGEILRLRSTDLDIEITLDVPAAVDTAGTVTVSGHMLNDITRKLPDGSQVEFAVEGQFAKVKSGRSRFQLQTLPAEDFPDFKKSEMHTKFALTGPDFRRLFAKTFFAISTEESRYYLNGVYLHTAADGNLRAVATDGHRLGMAWFKTAISGEFGVIVPRKTCALFLKHLDGFKNEVSVELSDHIIVVSWLGVRVASKLIDGTFPDYERVVPKGNQTVAIVDPVAMTAALDRASVVSHDKGRAAKFRFAPGELTVEVNSPDSGSATEVLDVDYQNPSMEIGFNSKYVMDLLGNITGKSLRWEMADNQSPTLVRVEGDGDQDCMAVLMPMRI